ncbi:MAG: 30S ribosomal protein S4 [Zestosphaera sp.]
MGDPRKSRRKWERPGHPWIKERLTEEMELVGKYGLRSKRELWLTQAFLRRIRNKAKSLLSLPPEDRVVKERELVRKLYRLGLLMKEESTIDDVLGLTVEDVLQRRLQTLVSRKGLARSIHEARQLVVHGHIAIGGRRVTSPGYIVSRDEEQIIDFMYGSPIASRVKAQAVIEEGSTDFTDTT